MSDEGGVTPSEGTHEVTLEWVTPAQAKGLLALGGFDDPIRTQTQSWELFLWGVETRGQVNRTVGECM